MVLTGRRERALAIDARRAAASGDHRRELLGALYTADCTYTDAHVDLRGADQIDGLIAQTQERFPGVTFTLGSPIDAHHNQARFQWHAGPVDKPDT